jgi:hypothetical protein
VSGVSRPYIHAEPGEATMEHPTLEKWRELCKRVEQEENQLADFVERVLKFLEFLKPIGAEEEY